MTKVQLSLRASQLKNVAGTFKGTSDPFAVITHIPNEQGEAAVVIGKTEVIKNTLSPNWTKVFVFDYELGKPMNVAVSIYDKVKKSENKSMGSAIFEIGAILGSRGNTKAKKVRGGTIFAHVQKSTGSGVMRLKMKALKLTNTEGFMRKSDPFFELSCYSSAAGGDTWDNVLRSKVVMDNLNPVWDDVVVDLAVLCGGDLDKPVKVTVYDYEKSGKHELMGEFETSVNGLGTANKNGNEIILKKRGKQTGKIVVMRMDIAGVESATEQMQRVTVKPTPTAYTPSVPASTGPTFVDYISGGCELNLTVAIDFTGSNGDPRDPNTLHHLKGDGSKNDYEKAISAIGSILAKYDSNQMFPVYGFGAKYDGVVRHCFQCGTNKEVHGVQGILDAYHHVFRTGLIMSGPTVFVEVIQTAAATAISAQEQAQAKGKQAYTILLILTDGAVTDVNATAEALGQASDAPLSIVIVGIGSADFSAMQFLDDQRSSGKRDVAQFVEFNQHRHNSTALTQATLDEIPGQLVSFFTTRGLKPNAAVRVAESDIVVAEEEEIDLSLAFGDDDEEIVVEAVGNSYRGGGF